MVEASNLESPPGPPRRLVVEAVASATSSTLVLVPGVAVRLQVIEVDIDRHHRRDRRLGPFKAFSMRSMEDREGPLNNAVDITGKRVARQIQVV